MNPQIPAKYTVFSAVLTAMGLAALLLPLPTPARVAIALAFLLGFGVLLGNELFEDIPFPWRTGLAALLFSAALMIAGSAIYYAYRLDQAMTALLLMGMGTAAGSLLNLRSRKLRVRLGAPDEPAAPTSGNPFLTAGGTLMAALAVALVAYGASILFAASTDLSIRSPWDVVPRMFFVIFFVAVLAVVAAAAGGMAPRLALIPAVAVAWLAVSVAAAAYQVGFGFDPFIHQATEAVIASQGYITPKPFYYVGQYVTVTLIARLTGIPVVAVDTWLVPVAFASVVPIAYWSLRRAFDLPRSVAATASLGLLLLPLSSFIMTTPQGFADALFLMTAFLSLPAVINEKFPRWPLFLLAAATTVIHPLAGIPLLVFLLILLYATTYDRTRGAEEAARRIVLIQLTLLGSVALPVVFILNSTLSGTAAGVAVDAEALRPSAIIEELQGDSVVTRRFQAAYDLVYSWRAWRSAILLLAGIVGIWAAWRRSRSAVVYALGAIVFLANFILLKSVIRFPFLISYERSNYADRIFELTLFLLAPLAIAAVAMLLKRVAASFPALRLGLAALIAILATSSLYLAYPRRDQYESSRGWSTSGTDIKAVQLIDADAKGTPYAVLANQSTSAAAVREFGFKRYFSSKDPDDPAPLFFYPIPTGGALYQRFLDINKAYGDYDVARKAMDLTGTDTVYFTVSYYWWEAQRIVLGAKKDAAKWWSVDDKVWVFKYTRTKTSGR